MLRVWSAVWRRCLSTRAAAVLEEGAGGSEGKLRSVVQLCRQGQLDEALSVLNWFRENGVRTPVKVYGHVLLLCKNYRSAAGLEAVLQLVEREGACQGSDSLQNAIVSTMVATGQVEEARRCYQRMEEGGVKLRQSTLSSLLENAVSRSDAGLVGLVLRSFARHCSFPNDEGLMRRVLGVCSPAEHGRDVVGVYRAVEREVEPGFAAAFAQWVKRYNNTIVCSFISWEFRFGVCVSLWLLSLPLPQPLPRCADS